MSFVILSIFLSYSLIAMQQEQKICYLARLPKAIQDLIAEYLMFDDKETDAELIERAIETLKLPSPISLCAPYGKISEGSRVACSSTVNCAIASYLTDRGKVLFVEKFHFPPAVSVVNLRLKKKIIQDQLSQLAAVKTAMLDSMILSKDESLVTRIFGIPSQDNPRLVNEIVVKDLNSENEKSIDRTDWKILACEFNKQSTKVIVVFPEDPLKVKPRYKIYPITSDQEHAAKSKKSLGEYFRQKMICKNLLNGLICSK